MTKDSRHHHRRNLQLGRRFYGLMIIIAALGIFVIFSVFFTQKISLREKLARALPADRTVAFMEFNFDQGLSETRELQTIASQNPLAKSALDYLTTLPPYPDQFFQWYAGRGGVAIFSSPAGQSFENALFLQVANRDKALNWINSLLLDPSNNALLDENYQGQKIISFRSGQTFNILLTNDLLVLSEEIDNLKMIADAYSGSTQDLQSQTAYQKLVSALPDQNQLFLYLDRNKLLDGLGKSDLFLAGRLASYKLYFPFLKLISNEAVAVRLSHGSDQKPLLIAKHLSLFNQSTLPTPGFFATDYSYSGNLEKFLPPRVTFTAGGVNLLDQKNKLQAYFKNRSSIYDLLFSGTLNSLKNYLQSSGSALDLDQDFFPLFQKEYLFFIGDLSTKQNGGTGNSQFSLPGHLGLIMDSGSPASDALKLQKVLLSIGTKLVAHLDAKPVPVVLPDGTPAKILSAKLSAPQTLSTNILGQSVQQIQFSADFSIYLFSDAANKHLLVSTSADLLSQMMASAQTAAGQTINYSLDKPTETYYLDLGQLAQFWPDAAGLMPLKSFTAARKFTEIGLLSTYQLGF